MTRCLCCQAGSSRGTGPPPVILCLIRCSSCQPGHTQHLSSGDEWVPQLGAANSGMHSLPQTPPSPQPRGPTGLSLSQAAPRRAEGCVGSVRWDSDLSFKLFKGWEKEPSGSSCFTGLCNPQNWARVGAQQGKKRQALQLPQLGLRTSGTCSLSSHHFSLSPASLVPFHFSPGKPI